MENPRSNLTQLRSFGILLGVASMIVAALFFRPFDENLNAVSLLAALAGVLALIAFLKPDILSKPFALWMKLGHLMGLVITPLVLGLIFFVVVFPIAMLAKVFRTPVINKTYDSSVQTYWAARGKPTSTMRDQF